MDRSNVKKNWYELGLITKSGSVWIVKDLLVRWNERQEERSGDDGSTEIEFVYDSYSFDYGLPHEVQPGVEAVEYYLEAAQSAVLQLAQDLAAQEAGFVDPD